MESAKLRLLPAQDDLLEAVLQFITSHPAQEWHTIHVVLPTQRLRVHLLARLTEIKAGFLAPQITNLDGFLSNWQVPVSTSLSTQQAEWLLSELLAQKPNPHLGSHHAHELIQIFGEMVDRDLDESFFASLLTVLQEDIFRDPDFVSALSHRIGFIEETFGHWHQYLAEQQFETGGKRRLRQVLAAKAELEQPDCTVPWQQLIVAGFTSLAPAYHPLMQQLVQRDDVVMIMTDPAALACPETAPLQQLVDSLATAVPTTKVKGAEVESPSCEIHQTKDPAHEIEQTFQQISQWIAAGIRPSDIGILVPDEALYGPLLRRRLRQADFPYNAAIATGFRETSLGRWLTALFQLCGEQSNTAVLLDFLRHPFTLSYLIRGEAELSSKAAPKLWARLQKAICDSGEYGGLSALPRLIQKQRDVELAPLFEKLAKLLRPFTHKRNPSLPAHEVSVGNLFETPEPEEIPDAASRLGKTNRPKPLKDWLDLYNQLLTEAAILDPRHHGGLRHSFTDQALVKASIVAFEGVWQELEQFSSHSRKLYSFASFQQLVIQALHAAEIRDVGEPLYGVQILSEREARYLRFEKCLILGCIEGCYPKALPRDDLLDDYLKTKAGLAGWRALEAIQNTTFNLLKANSQTLVLSTLRYADEREAVCSRFVETLRIEGVEVEPKVPAELPQSPDAITLPIWSEEGAVSSQLRARLSQRFSAHALEALIKCPFRFLTSKLQIRELQIPQADDPMSQGNWLHQVLEKFIAALQRNPDLLQAQLPEFIDSGLERLQRLTEAYAPAGTLTSPVGIQLQWHSYPAFLRHCFHLFGSAAKLMASQLEYTCESTIILSDGTNIPFFGIADRIDHGPHGSIVIDYKRRGGATRKDVAEGLAPQLVFYAQATPDNQGQLLGYWSILKGQWTGIAAAGELIAKGRELGLVSGRSPLTVGDAWAATDHLLTWRFQQQFNQNVPFGADTSRCDHCSFADLCRKDDPRLSARLENQQALNQRLASREVKA